MSQEIVLTAVLDIASGKWQRMNELFADALRYMQENEPGTLEFRVYQETEGDGNRGVLVERYQQRLDPAYGTFRLIDCSRYASEEALQKHRSSDSYTGFMKTMQDEQILTGPPILIQSKFLYGFARS